jgi:hypothetical protein
VSEVRKVVIARPQPLSAIIGGFAGAWKSGPDQPDRAALPMSRAALPDTDLRRAPRQEHCATSARRTVRLECIVRHLGLALGGRPAASLARRLMLPVSKDTLLRVVRRSAVRRDPPLNVIGIDDWAWKRGHRYGTLICDLERRRIADLLPDREVATVEAWLFARSSIAVIARDRGRAYSQAADQLCQGPFKSPIVDI